MRTDSLVAFSFVIVVLAQKANYPMSIFFGAVFRFSYFEWITNRRTHTHPKNASFCAYFTPYRKLFAEQLQTLQLSGPFKLVKPKYAPKKILLT